MTIPLVTIIAKSSSGKTTLMEKLIAEIKSRGYHLATIKHHSHSGFEIDEPGKDSWRFKQAGSDHVIIAAPDKIAQYRVLARELTLDEITAEIHGVDIILAEGYKRAGKPTIEVVRQEVGMELISSDDQLVAVATDVPLDIDVPQFDLNDPAAIVDFIEEKFIKAHS
jgi:molybdopterin-guanine dinucleotide biosynthesis protein B